MHEYELPWSPAAERNESPIAEALTPWLSTRTTVLEIGAGTGQHAVGLARRFPGVRWQPSDREENLAHVAERVRREGPPGCAPPIPLDLLEDAPAAFADRIPFAMELIYAANVLHIAPEEATDALFRLADSLLPAHGAVFVYGPFRSTDRPLEPSNAAFDLHLKERDPRMGLRDTSFVDAAAARWGFLLACEQDLPANNRARVHVRRAAPLREART